MSHFSRESLNRLVCEESVYNLFSLHIWWACHVYAFKSNNSWGSQLVASNMILCGLDNISLAAQSEISQFDGIALGKHFALHSPLSPPPTLRLVVCVSSSLRFLWLWPDQLCRLSRTVAAKQQTTRLLPSRLCRRNAWKRSEVITLVGACVSHFVLLLFSQRSRLLVCLVFHLLVSG